MREQSYNLLYEFAKEHQLGEVHALGVIALPLIFVPST
jgi:hypothetical protein